MKKPMKTKGISLRRRGRAKSQVVRLADVFLVGPLMMYGGLKGDGLHQAARIGLLVFGFGTIAFNGRNWLRVRRGEIPG